MKCFRIQTPSSWIYQYCFCKEFFYFFSSKEQGIEVCLAGDLFYFGIYFLVRGDIDTGEAHCLSYGEDIIHHDAVYERIYHEPEYTAIHHPEEIKEYQVWVND